MLCSVCTAPKQLMMILWDDGHRTVDEDYFSDDGDRLVTMTTMTMTVDDDAFSDAGGR